MAAKILDGLTTSQKILHSLQEKAQRLEASLAVIMVGNHPASLSYIRQKERSAKLVGIKYTQINLSENISLEELINEIHKLNQDPSIHGYIVQLPLPEHLQKYVPQIIREIDPKKDVDGFHAYNLGKMFLSPEFEDLPPATPLGIIKLLEEYKIKIEGKEVVVVGHSNLVGKPISTMLLNRNATVTTCHIYTQDLKSHTQRADILVVAVGKAGLITADMVKKGVVLIDVGINRIEDKTRKNGYRLVGDCDFENIKEKASYITPVPGGVGPMTVTALMLNTIHAAERQRNG